MTGLFPLTSELAGDLVVVGSLPGPPVTFRRLLYIYPRAEISIKEIAKELMCPVNDSQGESPTGIISFDHILRKQFYESAYMLV
jgi:hypothetical protein